MSAIETFSFQVDGISFTVDVICYGNFGLFSELYTMTDTHTKGVTVKNPCYYKSDYKYAIPAFSLAERAERLRRQGVNNPHDKAYIDTQVALARDFNASDYGFRVTAKMNDVVILCDEEMSMVFDYSHHDDGKLIDIAKEFFNEAGVNDEAIAAAKEKVAMIVEQMENLKKVLR